MYNRHLHGAGNCLQKEACRGWEVRGGYRNHARSRIDLEQENGRPGFPNHTPGTCNKTILDPHTSIIVFSCKVIQQWLRRLGLFQCHNIHSQHLRNCSPTTLAVERAVLCHPHHNCFLLFDILLPLICILQVRSLNSQLLRSLTLLHNYLGYPEGHQVLPTTCRLLSDAQKPEPILITLIPESHHAIPHHLLIMSLLP